MPLTPLNPEGSGLIKGQANSFEPPRLTPLGRLIDITKAFVVPNGTDFLMTMS